jgi:hypothetical protein
MRRVRLRRHAADRIDLPAFVDVFVLGLMVSTAAARGDIGFLVVTVRVPVPVSVAMPMFVPVAVAVAVPMSITRAHDGSSCCNAFKIGQASARP